MKKALVVVLVISLLALAAWVGWDYFTVDKCLDHGGRWNEAVGECEMPRTGGGMR